MHVEHDKNALLDMRYHVAVLRIHWTTTHRQMLCTYDDSCQVSGDRRAWGDTIFLGTIMISRISARVSWLCEQATTGQKARHRRAKAAACWALVHAGACGWHGYWLLGLLSAACCQC
jgi:hypothetical protein